jgi:3',5'-cyclic AMP phosphodiesterase CpdA
VNGTVSGLLLGTAVLVVLAVVLVCLRYPRQIVSHLTHWRTGPKQRNSYVVHRPAPAARLAFAGDVGHAGRQLDATGAAIAQLGVADPYDALVLLGDHAYPRGDPKTLARTVFGPFRAVLDQGTELLAVLGNHDVLDGHAAAQLDMLGMTARWWARDFGDLLLIGLDTNVVDDPTQHEFLHQTLDARRARWVVVALHHPPFSAGYQGSDHATRRAFVPTFARAGVDLVLSAHDHDYQRSHPIDGVTYIVSGGAAQARFTGGRSFTAASYRVRHFVEVAVLADRLVVRALDQQQRVFDELVLSPRDRTAMRGSVSPGS